VSAAASVAAAGSRRTAAITGRPRVVPVFAFGARDGWLVAATAAYAVALVGSLALGGGERGGGWGCRLGSIAVLATGLVWMSNTISHIHLHTPIFRATAANRVFSIVLTVILGIPQEHWKRRHLRHHGLAVGERRWSWWVDGVEMALLVAVWGGCAFALPAAFLETIVETIVPAWLLGLGLCAVQGHYEHALGATSHYGKAVQPALLQRRLSRRASRWMGSGDARYRGAFAGGLETTIPANCCSRRGADPHRTACGYSRRYSWPRTQRDRDARE